METDIGLDPDVRLFGVAKASIQSIKLLIGGWIASHRLGDIGQSTCFDHNACVDKFVGRIICHSKAKAKVARKSFPANAPARQTAARRSISDSLEAQCRGCIPNRDTAHSAPLNEFTFGWKATAGLEFVVHVVIANPRSNKLTFFGFKREFTAIIDALLSSADQVRSAVSFWRGVLYISVTGEL